MKSRKKDLRISRKSGATAVGRPSRNFPKSSRAIRSRNTRKVNSSTPSGLASSELLDAPQRDAVDQDQTTTHSFDLKDYAVGSEYRRKRADVTEYIKKRFLYDVLDSPRRLPRHHKLLSRSTAELMAASSHNLSKHKTRRIGTKAKKGVKISGPVQGERSRSAHKHLRPSTSKPPSSSSFKSYRKSKTNSVQLMTPKHTPASSHSTWDFPDPFENDGSAHSIYDGEAELNYDTVDFHPSRKLNSDAPLWRLHKKGERRLKAGKLRKPTGQDTETSKGNKTVAVKKPDLFFTQSFYSPGRSPTEDPYPDDIISFCPNRTNRNVGKSGPSGYDFMDGSSNSSQSPSLSDRRNQPPTEDLEEELLAPELTILPDSTCVTAGDGSLLTSFLQGGAILRSTAAVGAIGGSRRKSPVRPMQVLRTKATGSANSNSMLVPAGNLTQNPPLKQSVKHSRRTKITENNSSSRDDDFLPDRSSEPEQTDSDVCPTGARRSFKSASVLRLTAPMNMDTMATSIAIRSSNEQARQSEDGIPGSPIEDSGKFSDCGSAPGSKSGRSGKAALAKSLLLANNATSTRHRPSILRRASGTPKPEPDDENKNPVARSIGAFTPGSSAQSRKSGKKSTHNGSSEPTKLLQLITATSLSASSLTASEKLFGRRSGTHKPSLVTNVAMPVVETQHINSVKSAVKSPGSCRYAVLRGSANGKRYIVLGNNAIFDRSNITAAAPFPGNPATKASTTVDSVDLVGDFLSDNAESAVKELKQSDNRSAKLADSESGLSQNVVTLDVPDSNTPSPLVTEALADA